MKRVFIIVTALCVVVLAWMVFQFAATPRNENPPLLADTPTPTPENTQSELTIPAGDAVYSYAVIRAATASAITLIPNFSGRQDAKSLGMNNSCKESVNGGFYDTAGKPLGFFYTDKKTFGAKIPSALVNGFFWADGSGDAIISSDLPHTFYRFALQTGPLLLFNSTDLSLVIQKDEHARRMVVGKTVDGQFVFLAVYSKDSVYSGPLLASLPSIVSSISRKENLGIADAVNLDGGSASAFYNGETNLSELTPVGSLFCIQ